MSNESPVFNSSIPSNAKFADRDFIGYSAWIHKFFFLPFDHDGTDLSEDFLDILDIFEVHFNPAISKTRYQTNRLKHRFQKLGESPNLDSVISIHQSLTNAIMLAHIPTEFFSWPTHLTTAAGEIFLNVRAGTTEHDLTENQNSVKSDVVATSTAAELNVSHAENLRESSPDTQIDTDNLITFTKPDTNTMAHHSSDTKGNVLDTKGNVLDTLTTHPSTQTTDTTAVNRDTAHKESVLDNNNKGNVLDNLTSYKDPSYLSKVLNNEPPNSHTTENQTQDTNDKDNDDSENGAFLQPKKTFMLRKVQLKETAETTTKNRYDSLEAADDEEDEENDDDSFDAHLLRTPVTPGAGPDHETASSGFHSSSEYLFTQPSASPPTLSRAHIHGISTKISKGQHDLIPIDDFVQWIDTKTTQGQAHLDHMLETAKSKSKQVVASRISETKVKIDHLIATAIEEHSNIVKDISNDHTTVATSLVQQARKEFSDWIHNEFDDIRKGVADDWTQHRDDSEVELLQSKSILKKMRNECRIIETRFQFFLNQGKPLSTIIRDLEFLKVKMEQTSTTDIYDKFRKLDDTISILNHDIQKSKSTIDEHGTKLVIQQYDTDDNEIRIKNMEDYNSELNLKKPDASRWELDMFTLQSKFDSLQERCDPSQQDHTSTTKLDHRIKQLESLTHESLGNNTLQQQISTLETTIKDIQTAHSKDIALLRTQLNSFSHPKPPIPV